jgi:hypothetical protein
MPFSTFKIYLCKYLKFGMIFFTKNLRITPIFLHFSDFCEFSKISKYEIVNSTDLSVRCGPIPPGFTDFEKKTAGFCKHACIPCFPVGKEKIPALPVPLAAAPAPPPGGTRRTPDPLHCRYTELACLSISY